MFYNLQLTIHFSTQKLSRRVKLRNKSKINSMGKKRRKGERRICCSLTKVILIFLNNTYFIVKHLYTFYCHHVLATVRLTNVC
jgi:hypothetical protein